MVDLNRMQAVFDKLYEGFVKHLKTHHYVAEVTDPDALKEILLSELPSMVEVALDGDSQSGNGLDEMYSEDIYSCVKFKEDGDEDSDGEDGDGE